MFSSVLFNIIWVLCKMLSVFVLPILQAIIEMFLPSLAVSIVRRLRGMLFALPLRARGLKLDRISIDNFNNMRLGDNVKLYQGSVYSTGTKGVIQIGRDSHIGFNCVLAAGGGSISIGKGVAISSNVTMYTSSNRPQKDIKIVDSIYNSDIRIGDNVLIGMGVSILPGVTIGENVSIGAGAVVVRDVLPDKTVVGVPAKVV